ncbi:hypothetical protein H0H93_004596 [Arthromyces matolae]|nr:hypothetical protein H0H93_004596 [Arthromyces matolae]
MASILQDALPTSPASVGPRFRPYASPNHHVTKGRYITSNDPRGYIPVYEYPLNGQWIMMDIDDGYILWTGIWKALGNSKADIVKMIDSQPDLAPLIRRVRGGYLKIQGTWMPYEVALRLSRRVAWTIREDLIPLFGPTFPSTCLSPDQPGYGQVVATGNNRRRPRRNTQASTNTNSNASREPWTVVTHNPTNANHGQAPQTPYLHTSFYSANRDTTAYRDYHIPSSSPPHNGPSLMEDPASPANTSRSVRYTPYTSHGSYPDRRLSLSLESRKDLSLDIPSLSLRDNGRQPAHSNSRAPVPDMENITLPPIHAPTDSGNSSSPYALPPISAMEDLRGIHANDSAAVLRRLRADDPPLDDVDEWRAARSLTTKPARNDSREVFASRSYPNYPNYRQRSHSYTESEYEDIDPNGDSGLSLSVPSDTSHSTCGHSPISPTTPHSLSSRDHDSWRSHATSKDSQRYHALSVPKVAEWPGTHHPHGHEEMRVSHVRGGRRHSDTDSETHPHRPW